MPERVGLHDITKRFGDVRANDHVDLTLHAGEVHALLGENGAGKTTLMNILSGLYQPDGGQILIDGRRARFRSPRDAIACGIGMVHQHFELIDTFTVIENLALGRPTGLVHRSRLRTEITGLSRKLGLHVEAQALTWQLSVGERQRAEIVRLLHRGARILVLDEPTSVLTPQEADALFGTLRRLAAEGHVIVLITHKLYEVMRVADRITILRGGRVVAERRPSDTTPRELAQLMVGRAPAPEHEKPVGRAGAVLLRVDAISALGNRGNAAVREVSFEVRSGELLGVAGVAGNGQRELAEVVAGLRLPTSGRVEVNGVDVTGKGVRAALDVGLGYVPEERLGVGLVSTLGLVDNMILRCYRTPPVGGRWRIDREAARSWAQRLVSGADVRTVDFDGAVSLLSGGNQQRALMAREIATHPRVLLAVYPTRGLDVGAAERVHAMLLALREQGSAIVLISEDLDEILALSDRVLVLFRGNVAGVRPAARLSREAVGLLMGGGGVSFPHEGFH